MTAQAAGGGPELSGGATEDSVARPDHAATPLQRLILQRLKERKWSYGDVARRGGLPRSTVYTLATTRNLVRPPRPATIDALARGLDVPVSAVRAAAAESTGLHYYDEAPTGTAAARRSGAGPADRQHRRALPGGPQARGGARRIAAQEGVGRAGGRLATPARPLRVTPSASRTAPRGAGHELRRPEGDAARSKLRHRQLPFTGKARPPGVRWDESPAAGGRWPLETGRSVRPPPYNTAGTPQAATIGAGR